MKSQTAKGVSSRKQESDLGRKGKDSSVFVDGLYEEPKGDNSTMFNPVMSINKTPTRSYGPTWEASPMMNNRSMNQKIPTQDNYSVSPGSRLNLGQYPYSNSAQPQHAAGDHRYFENKLQDSRSATTHLMHYSKALYGLQNELLNRDATLRSHMQQAKCVGSPLQNRINQTDRITGLPPNVFQYNEAAIRNQSSINTNTYPDYQNVAPGYYKNGISQDIKDRLHNEISRGKFAQKLQANAHTGYLTWTQNPITNNNIIMSKDKRLIQNGLQWNSYINTLQGTDSSTRKTTAHIPNTFSAEYCHTPHRMENERTMSRKNIERVVKTTQGNKRLNEGCIISPEMCGGNSTYDISTRNTLAGNFIPQSNNRFDACVSYQKDCGSDMCSKQNPEKISGITMSLPGRSLSGKRQLVPVISRVKSDEIHKRQLSPKRRMLNKFKDEEKVSDRKDDEDDTEENCNTMDNRGRAAVMASTGTNLKPGGNSEEQTCLSISDSTESAKISESNCITVNNEINTLEIQKTLTEFETNPVLHSNNKVLVTEETTQRSNDTIFTRDTNLRRASQTQIKESEKPSVHNQQTCDKYIHHAQNTEERENREWCDKTQQMQERDERSVHKTSNEENKELSERSSQLTHHQLRPDACHVYYTPREENTEMSDTNLNPNQIKSNLQEDNNIKDRTDTDLKSAYLSKCTENTLNATVPNATNVMRLVSINENGNDETVVIQPFSESNVNTAILNGHEISFSNHNDRNNAIDSQQAETCVLNPETSFTTENNVIYIANGSTLPENLTNIISDDTITDKNTEFGIFVNESISESNKQPDDVLETEISACSVINVSHVPEIEPISTNFEESTWNVSPESNTRIQPPLLESVMDRNTGSPIKPLCDQPKQQDNILSTEVSEHKGRLVSNHCSTESDKISNKEHEDMKQTNNIAKCVEKKENEQYDEHNVQAYDENQCHCVQDITRESVSVCYGKQIEISSKDNEYVCMVNTLNNAVNDNVMSDGQSLLGQEQASELIHNAQDNILQTEVVNVSNDIQIGEESFYDSIETQQSSVYMTCCEYDEDKTSQDRIDEDNGHCSQTFQLPIMLSDDSTFGLGDASSNVSSRAKTNAETLEDNILQHLHKTIDIVCKTPPQTIDSIDITQIKKTLDCLSHRIESAPINEHPLAHSRNVIWDILQLCGSCMILSQVALDRIRSCVGKTEKNQLGFYPDVFIDTLTILFKQATIASSMASNISEDLFFEYSKPEVESTVLPEASEHEPMLSEQVDTENTSVDKAAEILKVNCSSDIFDINTASANPDTNTASDHFDSNTTPVHIDTDIASDHIDTNTASAITDTNTASAITDTNTASDHIDSNTTPVHIDTNTPSDHIDTDTASDLIDTNTASVHIDTNSALDQTDIYHPSGKADNFGTSDSNHKVMTNTISDKPLEIVDTQAGTTNAKNDTTEKETNHEEGTEKTQTVVTCKSPSDERNQFNNAIQNPVYHEITKDSLMSSENLTEKTNTEKDYSIEQSERKITNRLKNMSSINKRTGPKYNWQARICPNTGTKITISNTNNLKYRSDYLKYKRKRKFKRHTKQKSGSRSNRDGVNRDSYHDVFSSRVNSRPGISNTNSCRRLRQDLYDLGGKDYLHRIKLPSSIVLNYDEASRFCCHVVLTRTPTSNTHSGSYERNQLKHNGKYNVKDRIKLKETKHLNRSVSDSNLIISSRNKETNLMSFTAANRNNDGLLRSNAYEKTHLENEYDSCLAGNPDGKKPDMLKTPPVDKMQNSEIMTMREQRLNQSPLKHEKETFAIYEDRNTLKTISTSQNEASKSDQRLNSKNDVTSTEERRYYKYVANNTNSQITSDADGNRKTCHSIDHLEDTSNSQQGKYCSIEHSPEVSLINIPNENLTKTVPLDLEVDPSKIARSTFSQHKYNVNERRGDGKNQPNKSPDSSAKPNQRSHVKLSFEETISMLDNSKVNSQNPSKEKKSKHIKVLSHNSRKNVENYRNNRSRKSSIEENTSLNGSNNIISSKDETNVKPCVNAKDKNGSDVICREKENVKIINANEKEKMDGEQNCSFKLSRCNDKQHLTRETDVCYLHQIDASLETDVISQYKIRSKNLTEMEDRFDNTNAQFSERPAFLKGIVSGLRQKLSGYSPLKCETEESVCVPDKVGSHVIQDQTVTSEHSTDTKHVTADDKKCLAPDDKCRYKNSEISKDIVKDHSIDSSTVPNIKKVFSANVLKTTSSKHVATKDKSCLTSDDICRGKETERSEYSAINPSKSNGTVPKIKKVISTDVRKTIPAKHVPSEDNTCLPLDNICRDKATERSEYTVQDPSIDIATVPKIKNVVHKDARKTVLAKQFASKDITCVPSDNKCNKAIERSEYSAKDPSIHSDTIPKIKNVVSTDVRKTTSAKHVASEDSTCLPSDNKCRNKATERSERTPKDHSVICGTVPKLVNAVSTVVRKPTSAKHGDKKVKSFKTDKKELCYKDCKKNSSITADKRLLDGNGSQKNNFESNKHSNDKSIDNKKSTKMNVEHQNITHITGNSDSRESLPDNINHKVSEVETSLKSKINTKNGDKSRKDSSKSNTKSKDRNDKSSDRNDKKSDRNDKSSTQRIIDGKSNSGYGGAKISRKNSIDSTNSGEDIVSNKKFKDNSVSSKKFTGNTIDNIKPSKVFLDIKKPKDDTSNLKNSGENTLANLKPKKDVANPKTHVNMTDNVKPSKVITNLNKHVGISEHVMSKEDKADTNMPIKNKDKQTQFSKDNKKSNKNTKTTSSNSKNNNCNKISKEVKTITNDKHNKSCNKSDYNKIFKEGKTVADDKDNKGCNKSDCDKIFKESQTVTDDKNGNEGKGLAKDRTKCGNSTNTDNKQLLYKNIGIELDDDKRGPTTGHDTNGTHLNSEYLNQSEQIPTAGHSKEMCVNITAEKVELISEKSEVETVYSNGEKIEILKDETSECTKWSKLSDIYNMAPIESSDEDDSSIQDDIIITDPICPPLKSYTDSGDDLPSLRIPSKRKCRRQNLKPKRCNRVDLKTFVEMQNILQDLAPASLSTKSTDSASDDDDAKTVTDFSYLSELKVVPKVKKRWARMTLTNREPQIYSPEEYLSAVKGKPRDKRTKSSSNVANHNTGKTDEKMALRVEGSSNETSNKRLEDFSGVDMMKKEEISDSHQELPEPSCESRTLKDCVVKEVEANGSSTETEVMHAKVSLDNEEKHRTKRKLTEMDDPETEIIPPFKKRGLSCVKDCFTVLDKLYNHELSEPFRQEIRSKDVPDYYKIIKRGMCYDMIAHKLRNGFYDRLRDFVDDMRLVFSNCFQYHSTDHETYIAGCEMQKLFEKKLKETFPNTTI